MINRAAIADLVPHGGAMVLLDEVEAWDAQGIACRAGSHLDAANPLRSRGRLAALAGIEYGLQAAALHGALTRGGRPQPAGYLASLREVALLVERLDDASLGRLRIAARQERQEERGLIYSFDIRAEAGQPLLSGSAVIMLPLPA